MTDIGLLRRVNGSIAVANPIYREVLPRMLAFTPEASLPQKWEDKGEGGG